MEDICHCIGLCCDGFEGDLMAVIMLLKQVISVRGGGECVSNSKSANRGIRELKRSSCSINYDSKGGSSSRSRVKGRGLLVVP